MPTWRRFALRFALSECFAVYVVVLSVSTTAVSTLSTTALPVPQCSSDEQHTTLNYEDTVQGTSQLLFFVLLPDYSLLDTDVSRALRGSGNCLQKYCNNKSCLVSFLLLTYQPRYVAVSQLF